jgi:hypothetical protein
MKKTMSISQAAAFIGITRQATWLAIKEGNLSATMKEIGFLHVWRITVEEVERYRNEREKK